VTPVKIKIKEVKAKISFHHPTSPIYKTYPIRIVKGNLTFLNNPFNMAKIHSIEQRIKVLGLGETCLPQAGMPVLS